MSKGGAEDRPARMGGAGRLVLTGWFQPARAGRPRAFAPWRIQCCDRRLARSAHIRLRRTGFS